MSFEVSILLDIAIILLFAKLLGEITERLKIGALIGEVCAGIVAGPLLGLVHPSDLLFQIASLGIFFLLFLIGLETKIDEIKGDIYTGVYLAVLGAVFAFAAGFAIGYFMFSDVTVGVFLGIAILSTSTAITLRTLKDIGEFKSPVYQISLIISMADDVLAILSLSLLVTFLTHGSVNPLNVFTLFLIVLGFFFLIITAGARYVNRFLSLVQRLADEQMLVSIPLVILFFVAYVSENVGVAGVTGAFLAGLAMSRSSLNEPIIFPKIKILGFGFFIPLFFAYSGLILDFTVLSSSWYLVGLLVLVGSIAKIIGTGIISRFWGYNLREQMLIGIGMIPHGEYSIVIAQIALASSVIAKDLYTAIIAFVIITILITPPLLRLANGKRYRSW
ncbi:MAG: cation:proton antiporter [Candidatus Aenigmarchaeota archaeon]|nr:cation:proton antiporter [Candidatus Aenigmarchaeota archaeon]